MKEKTDERMDAGPWRIYHGIYDIPKKGSDHSEQWESEEIYSFLICVVAPVDKDYNAGTPKCGFIFPAFEDRSAEPGKIDVFFEIPEHLDEGFLKSLIVYQKIWKNVAWSSWEQRLSMPIYRQ